MSLTLYLHPLASYCHKVLVALYENDTPFTPRVVDLGDPDDRAEVLAASPLGKIPILLDGARGRTVFESTPIIEHVCRFHAGRAGLLPADDDERFDARLWDRFLDNHVHLHMQKIVGDRLRREGDRDPQGVAEAKAALAVAYAMLERQLATGAWAAGARFTLADCAAAPALFYAAIVAPFPDGHPNLNAYFDRLMERPSVRRVLDEARPWFELFPFRDEIPERFAKPSSAPA